MISVIAHYQEIALKGKNRPWFLHRLVRNLRELLEDLDVQEVRTPMGRIEIVLARRARLAGGARSAVAHVRAGQLLAGASGAARSSTR